MNNQVNKRDIYLNRLRQNTGQHTYTQRWPNVYLPMNFHVSQKNNCKKKKEIITKYYFVSEIYSTSRK